MLAIQIVKVAMQPDVTVAELIAVCENDPAFVIRLLSHVNSASFGLNHGVSNAQQAVSVLGVRGVRQLALTTCMAEMSPPGDLGDVLLGLCLRRGVAARLLAQALGRRDPADYFTAGVLLEVGLLVTARDNPRAASSVALAPAATRPMLERAEGREDHPSVGAELVKSWALGPQLVDAIARHHDKEPPPSELAAVAWLAERLAGVFEGGDPASLHGEAVEAGGKLKLNPIVVEEILMRIPEAVKQLATEMDHEVGPQVPLETVLRDANTFLVELNRNYVEVVARLERMLSEKEQLAQQLAESNRRLEAANEQLSSLARTDGLTGLSNHRAFAEALERDLARTDRSRTPLSLVVLDVDHFKRVNDTHGHQVGDAVLKAVGEILRSSIRVSDVAARIGGEEFALILPGTAREGAMVVAERVRVTLAKREFQCPTGAFKVTGSLGIASVQGPGCRNQSQAVVAIADKALYAAKHAGRNRTEVGALPA
jgi:diguanylate cyclase (GGDEF)-like protein